MGDLREAELSAQLEPAGGVVLPRSDVLNLKRHQRCEILQTSADRVENSIERMSTRSGVHDRTLSNRTCERYAPQPNRLLKNADCEAWLSQGELGNGRRRERLRAAQVAGARHLERWSRHAKIQRTRALHCLGVPTP